MNSYILRRLIFFCAIALAGSPLLAQSITLQGQVIDSLGQQPVPYATVSVWLRDSVLVTGTTTDEKGLFLIPGAPAGDIHLRVQLIGYKTIRQAFKNNGQSQVTLPTMFLHRSEVALDELVVKGEKAASSLQLDKQVYTTKQFQNAAGGTGLDLMQRLPSVTVNNEGAITLRGSANFQVMINGKPSARTAADILAQLPANQIEQVEIITSPSARYDSDGKTGIINIITKKDVEVGWSLSGNGLFAGVSPARYGGDGAVAYNSRRWNAFVSADFRRYNIDGFRGGEVRTVFQDTLTYLPSQGIRDWKDVQYSIRTGGSYSFNSQSVLNVAYYAGYKQTDRIANLHYHDFIRTGQPLDLYSNQFGAPACQFFNQNLFSRTGRFQTVNADYSRTFANKAKLNVIGLFEYSILGGPLRNSDQVEGIGTVTLQERSDERSPLNAWRLQADWVQPLPGNKRLEMGYQWRRVRHQGDFTFERLNLETQSWEADAGFADQMDLVQQIHAGYLQLAGQRKTFSYNVGIRLESTNRRLTHLAQPKPYQYDALNLFPSLQGIWKLSEAQTLRIGFNRRIDRPTTKAMSPFKNHRHAEAIELGDPNLKPEITDVLDASYSHAWQPLTLTLTAYANRAKDRIFRVNDLYNRIILLRTYTNAGTARSVGAELSGEWRLLPWWRLYGSGNIYELNIKGTYQGADIQQKSVNYNLSGNTTINIAKRLSFQYDINYVSRTVTSQGYDTGLLLSNAGIRYSLLKGKGTVGIQLTNVFNTNVQTIVTQTATFYSATEYRKYNRVLQLTAGFRINDSAKKVKPLKTDYGEKDF